GLGRAGLNRVAAKRAGAGSRPVARCSALFLVHHPKFVQYLQPIAAELTDRAPVWVALQASLSDQLCMEGQACIALAASHSLAGVKALWRPPCPGYGSFFGQFDALYRLCSEQRPGCVVVAEGNASIDEIMSQVGRLLGIPVLCIQHGWAPIPHNGFRNWSYAAALMWGEGFADVLKPLNPGQRFMVTGSHILDSGLDWRPPERPAVSFFLQAATRTVSPELWQDFLELITDTATRCPEATVRVREHPSHPLTPGERAWLARKPNVEFADPASHSLMDVLRATSVTVAISSTTILESAAFLVPPVIYNRTSMPKYSPDVDALGAGIEVHDRAAALNAIAHLLQDADFLQSFEPKMLAFRERFFHRFDGRSLGRVVEAIREVAAPS
ncbi:MAG TPA: hypothetical protein VKU60_11520, partial [Chloroflexota bacterium]|nr:hypothetical protein [Chloroflexota bacterium]